MVIVRVEVETLLGEDVKFAELGMVALLDELQLEDVQ